MAWSDIFRRDRSGAPAPALARLIPDYPPYRPPFAKLNAQLTLEEAQANHAALMVAKPGRLARLAELLTLYGLDLHAGIEAANPRPFLDALWRWTVAEWPSIQAPDLTGVATWLSGSRRDSPVFGLITDVGLLLGEGVVRRRPDYTWALDLDATDRTMAYWRRTCVIRSSDGVVPALVYDPEDAARAAYHDCAGATYRLMNELARGALDCIDAAHERAWREEAERLGRSVLPDLQPETAADDEG